VGESSKAGRGGESGLPTPGQIAATSRRRKHWGWGYEDEQPTLEQLGVLARALEERLGFPFQQPLEPFALAKVSLQPARIAPPAALVALCTDAHYDRVRHSHGSSYCEVVDGFYGRFAHVPDLVAYPREERQLEELLGWCAQERVAAIPYGGGTSVVGGVRPAVPATYTGVLSIDLSNLSGLYELDSVSGAARIGAGSSGPALEGALAQHGFTLRHYPQSFAFSTLGGWIATRAAGHFATGQTHIEDHLEAVRMVTPAGLLATRRLPASGAGSDPLRLVAGSEGALGVITEAWVRVRKRPQAIVRATVSFERFELGAQCLAELLQSGLLPANCRLLDEREAAFAAAGEVRGALLLLAFESAARSEPARRLLGAQMDQALSICAAHGGDAGDGPRFHERSSAAAEPSGVSDLQAAGTGAREQREAGWREAFLGAPYLRDAMVACGVFTETFETAVSWDRFPSLDSSVRSAAAEALGSIGVSESNVRVSARLTHAYPDGAAPYYTVIAPAKRGEEAAQWQTLKSAISDAILAGRDHMPWYSRERTQPFAAAFAGAKSALDPRWVLNPGVLLDAAPLS
jgi:alkyldihydroxyacetonephosphate synthase